MWTLSWIDGAYAAAVLGMMLLIWCAFSFAAPQLRLPDRLERPLAPLSGFLTGIVNGVTGSQVMPAVPFLMSLKLERNLFIQAVNCSFTLSSLVMAAGLGLLDLFAREDLLISALGTCVVFAGLRVGARVRENLSEALFRNVVLLMLSVMAASLIIPILS